MAAIGRGVGWSWVVLVIATGGCSSKAKAVPPGVVCWGNGTSGQLGPARSARPAHVEGLDAATKLFLTSSATCARVPSGPLQCLGDLSGKLQSANPAPLTTIPDAVEVAGGTLFSCARRASGAVSCWGSNLIGELGNGRAPDPNQKVPIEIDRDGRARAPEIAGGNEDVPVDVAGLGDATAIAVSAGHTCALRRTGVVVCWGEDDVGQLGDGRSGYAIASDHPVEVAGLVGVLGIAVGDRISCARTADAVSCWGSLSERYPPSTDSKPAVWQTPTKIQGLTTVDEIAAAETSACARTHGGDVMCWGPDGKTQNKGLHGVAQLVAGGKHFCARLASGGVSCWGENMNGQLGAEFVDNSIGRVDVPDLGHVIDLAAGTAHTCVIVAR